MPEKKVRIGIVGANVNYGWGSRAHLPALKALPMTEVVAVFTAHKETAEETAKAFNIPMAFSNLEDMLNRKDIDLIDVCVRVPGHHALVMAALQAGKHVFCEWPLGTNTTEAKQMADLAKAKGVWTMIGLQARGSPSVNQIKSMIADGYVGQVVAVNLSQFGPSAGRPGGEWVLDRKNGVNVFTIAGGHSIDALCYAVADFQEVSAKVTTQRKRITIAGTKDPIEMTSPDNVLISGVLKNGAVASVHVAAMPHHGTGFKLEIYGTEGTLIATASAGPNTTELNLVGGRGTDTALQPIAIQPKYTWVPAAVPLGAPFNVAQVMQHFGEAIQSGKPAELDFNHALKMHHLLDTIQAASDTGKVQTVHA
ncbi:MAG: Gfo/Idh/MocA family oxidoreductase [Dehalococcoidia bacterium]|nr:Gfo/Idh/MocA family oxidoreductase [Dehalococcoidia bacterium]